MCVCVFSLKIASVNYLYSAGCELCDIELKRPSTQLILLNKLSSCHIFRLDSKPSSGHSVIRAYRYFSLYGFSRIVWMTVLGETSVKFGSQSLTNVKSCMDMWFPVCVNVTVFRKYFNIKPKHVAILVTRNELVRAISH